MGLLDGKISENDKNAVNNMRNHGDTELGFEEDEFGSDSFGDLNDLFGGDDFGGSSNQGFDTQQSNQGFGAFGTQQSNQGFGTFGTQQSNQGFGTFGAQQPNQGFGAFSAQQPNQGFGALGVQQPNQGFGAFNSQNIGSPFAQTQSNQQPQQPDIMDKTMDVFAQTAEASGNILMEMVRSIKLRTLDDLGYFSRNSILTGIGLVIGAILLGIIGGFTHIPFISFLHFPLQLISAGTLTAALGMTGIGLAAFLLSKRSSEITDDISKLDDLSHAENNNIDEFESDLDAALDDLFGTDFDNDSDNDLFGSDTSEDSNNSDANSNEDEDDTEPEEINYDELLEDVKANSLITRENLFNTFKEMFPTNTLKFAEVTEIKESSEDFSSLDTIATKALANIANCTLEEVGNRLESAKSTLFSYELKIRRMNKVKKTDDIAREIEVYLREDSNDENINAVVTTEGDFYKVIVTKGTNAIVTFGDIFKQEYCRDFFCNKKNKLPMITGIDELGKVILDDAKYFDTMLIAGKPRSGKSWYVLSILMSLMLFNSPEDVQFVIIDPKKSSLFHTISLMPHVCGLHDDKEILSILDDIIDVEAPHRKDVLAKEDCDDIWALRDKGVKMPLLYLVIDEYMTIINNMDKDEQKEFNSKIQILISQLPSQGIRLIFVPHRTTSVVDKTNRTMLQFTAAVKADIEDVKDTLGITKWTRALTKPGDIAVKTSNMRLPHYVRGAALTTDDNENKKWILAAAKAFYKMGVAIPSDLSRMHIAYNRNEQEIYAKVTGNQQIIQFDSSEDNSYIEAKQPSNNISKAPIIDDNVNGIKLISKVPSDELDDIEDIALDGIDDLIDQ